MKPGDGTWRSNESDPLELRLRHIGSVAAWLQLGDGVEKGATVDVVKSAWSPVVRSVTTMLAKVNGAMVWAPSDTCGATPGSCGPNPVPVPAPTAPAGTLSADAKASVHTTAARPVAMRGMTSLIE